MLCHQGWCEEGLYPAHMWMAGGSHRRGQHLVQRPSCSRGELAASAYTELQGWCVRVLRVAVRSSTASPDVFLEEGQAGVVITAQLLGSHPAGK